MDDKVVSEEVVVPQQVYSPEDAAVINASKLARGESDLVEAEPDPPPKPTADMQAGPGGDPVVVQGPGNFTEDQAVKIDKAVTQQVKRVQRKNESAS